MRALTRKIEICISFLIPGFYECESLASKNDSDISLGKFLALNFAKKARNRTISLGVDANLAQGKCLRNKGLCGVLSDDPELGRLWAGGRKK